MKLKENWKRFWKLTARHDGFTLVELIVVIAILAILAGVAVPVYSGYIEKANLAADQQLLAAVNKAFAAACAENGADQYNLNGSPSLTYAADKKAVTGVTMYNDSFLTYYAGNEGTAFKVMRSIVYHAQLGMFVDAETYEGSIALSYGGGYIYVNADDLSKLNDSSFIQDMGITTLLNQVGLVTDFAAEFESGVYDNLFVDDNYLRSMCKALGVTGVDEMHHAELEQAFADKIYPLVDAEYAKLIQDKGELTEEEQNEYYEQVYNKVLANTAVLYAAQNAQNDTQSIMDMLKYDGEGDTAPKKAISDSLASSYGAGLTNASVAYALYTAYAYDSGDAVLIAKTENPVDILNDLNSAGFQAYLKTSQAQVDLEGFLAAMNMINGSGTDSNAVSNLLVNGFTDTDLQELLSGATGSN